MRARQSLFIVLVTVGSSIDSSFAFANLNGRSNAASSTKASSSVELKMGLLDSLFGGLGLGPRQYEKCVMGDESIMSQKAHGTSQTPVQKDLRWNCDNKTADQICNFNRHYAEYRVSIFNCRHLSFL